MQLAQRPEISTTKKLQYLYELLTSFWIRDSLVTSGFKGALLAEAWEWKENKIVWATEILKAGGPIEIECFDFHRTLSGKK